MITTVLTMALLGAQDRELRDTLRDAQRALRDNDSWRVHMSLTAGEQNDVYDGEGADETVHLTGAMEAYCREAATVVQAGGRWQRAQDVDGAEGARAAAIKNPYLLTAEFFACSARAESDGEETLTVGEESVDCEIVTARADERQTEAQIRDLLSRTRAAAQYFDPANAVDAQNSRSEYRAWIGREDHRIYRIAWTLEPRFRTDMLPQGVPLPQGADQYLEDLRADTTCDFSAFGEVEEVEVAREARAILR